MSTAPVRRRIAPPSGLCPRIAAALAGAAAATAAGGTAVAAPVQYTLSNLGIPDTGDTAGNGSAAIGINSSGTVTGYLTGSNGNFNGFVGNSASVTTLPTLGGPNWFASAINDAGQVAGTSAIAGSPAYLHATLWSASKTATDLGTLPGSMASHATGINGTGQVAGYSIDSAGSAYPFRTSANGQGMTQLSTLGASQYAVTFGINNAGVVSGSIYATDANSTYVGAYWDSAGTAHAIPLFGGDYGAATGINNAGHITGFSTVDSTDGPSSAFIYDTTTGQMTDLGSLGAAFPAAEGWSINDSDVVVGTSYDASLITGHAFIDANGQMQDLNALVDAPGWTLQDAFGINDAGQIVGDGIDPAGEYHAFLLTPTSSVPEPASLAVAAVAVAGFTAGGRRRRKHRSAAPPGRLAGAAFTPAIGQ